MSDRDETLAGLTEVLEGHDGYWTMYPVEGGRLHWRVVCSGCDSEIGKGRTPSPGVLAFADIHRAHVANVVLAHLEAQGWAQGREEWGYESMSQSLEPCIRFASSKESAIGFARIGANGRAVRRRVTDWEPVDGGA